MDGFERIGAAEDGAVIGISTTTDDVYKYRALAKSLRARFRNATIIGGGSHFARESIDGYMDAVEETLRAGDTDAVVVGHAQPFVDLIAKHGGKLEDVDAPGFYMLDPGSDRVVGHGRGKYPAVGEVPYDVFEGKRGVKFLLSNACRNGCDYCPVSKEPRPLFTTDMVVESMLKVFRERDTRAITLFDPNPFDPKFMGYYEETMGALDKGHRTLKSVYMDPAALASESQQERAADMILKSMMLVLFAGRDQVTEEGSKIIGRRYHGKLRDQAMLDGEKRVLTNLVSGMNKMFRRRRMTIPLEITFSYILTHMETRESAMAAYEDMMDFIAQGDDLVRIKIEINPLMPYPGTRVRRNHKDAIDLTDFDFYRDTGKSLSPWKADAGPGVVLMRRAAVLNRNDGARAAVDDFKRAIDLSF
jgi:hypothetical protein